MSRQDRTRALTTGTVCSAMPADVDRRIQDGPEAMAIFEAQPELQGQSVDVSAFAVRVAAAELLVARPHDSGGHNLA